MLVSYTVSEVVRVCNDLWLSVWTDNDPNRDFPDPSPPPVFGDDPNMFYLWIYIILGAGYCLLNLVRSGTAFARFVQLVTLRGFLTSNFWTLRNPTYQCCPRWPVCTRARTCTMAWWPISSTPRSPSLTSRPSVVF